MRTKALYAMSKFVGLDNFLVLKWKSNMNFFIFVLWNCYPVESVCKFGKLSMQRIDPHFATSTIKVGEKTRSNFQTATTTKTRDSISYVLDEKVSMSFGKKYSAS